MTVTHTYCLNSSTIRPAPLMEKIRIAAKVGYDAIELWTDDLDAYVTAGGRLGDVQQALSDGGLAVPTVIALHGWLGSTGAEHAAAVVEAARRMEQAVAVGAARIIASPPLEACDLSCAGDQYRELLELGDRIGIAPAIEFLGFVASVFTAEQAWQICVDADHPHASVVMDPFHMLRGGGDIASISLIPGERVAIWHWNDLPAQPPAREQSDADRVMPGDGVAPLEQIEKLARGAGYAGAVSLELFNEAYWAGDAEQVAALGLRKMRRFFTS